MQRERAAPCKCTHLPRPQLLCARGHSASVCRVRAEPSWDAVWLVVPGARSRLGRCLKINGGTEQRGGGRKETATMCSNVTSGCIHVDESTELERSLKEDGERGEDGRKQGTDEQSHERLHSCAGPRCSQKLVGLLVTPCAASVLEVTQLCQNWRSCVRGKWSSSPGAFDSTAFSPPPKCAAFPGLPSPPPALAPTATAR